MQQDDKYILMCYTKTDTIPELKVIRRLKLIWKVISLNIKEEALKVFDEVVAMRRHFHMFPEPPMAEYETSKVVQAQLKAMGIPFETVGETGVVGMIGSGHPKTIALRADMDALMIQEQSQVSYKSQNDGCMHACGHDGHTASLLGATKILKAYEDLLNVNVKLIFQPAEENCLGAKLMIENHVLDGVDAIYGVHIFTDIPSGKVSVEAGPRMASTDMFKAVITGRAGHAAKPHQCVDATVAAAAAILNLQSIISREMDPVDSGVVTVGQLHSGTQYNIISGEAVFEGTVRSFAKETSQHIQNSIERIVSMTAAAYGAAASFEFKPSRHPVVYNDETLVKVMAQRAEDVLGAEAMNHVPPMMLGEDFSSYQAMVPGIFAFVGAGNAQKGCVYPNHHDCFDIDEDALLDCVILYVLFAMSSD